MRWFKYSAILLGILLALALILPFLIPLKTYIPPLEQLASDKLGEQVTITDLSFSLLPLPSATLHGLSIGKTQPIQVESITVRPALGSLWQEVKVLRAVEVKGFSVDRRMLGLAGALAKPGDGGPQLVRVERVKLRAMRLNLEVLKWGPLRADIALHERGVEEVEAASEDGKFKLQLTPGSEKATQDLLITAKDWPLPIKPAFQFEQLTAKGLLRQNTLNISDIDGKLYGGKLVGKVDVDWKRDWKVTGEVQVSNVETKEAVALLTRSVAVSGKLHTQGGFTLRAKEPKQLADSLKGNFKFEVKQGVLYGFDLAQAVESKVLPGARSGTRGGQTRFDTFTGVAQISGKQYRLRQLKVTSGALSANGDVSVAANQRLSGQVNVALTSVAGLAVPLDVSGTLSEPVLLPNAAALAGAAAGTALMGPGFGTGLGTKAGQALEALFQ